MTLGIILSCLLFSLKRLKESRSFPLLSFVGSELFSCTSDSLKRSISKSRYFKHQPQNLKRKELPHIELHFPAACPVTLVSCLALCVLFQLCAACGSMWVCLHRAWYVKVEFLL